MVHIERALEWFAIGTFVVGIMATLGGTAGEATELFAGSAAASALLVVLMLRRQSKRA